MTGLVSNITVYSSIGAMHGAGFFAISTELETDARDADEAATSRLFLQRKLALVEAILEQVADRDLQNSAIGSYGVSGLCGAPDLAQLSQARVFRPL
jgi:hypothetical protein